MSSPEENALAVTDEERALAFYEENQEATDVPDSAGIPRIAVVQPMSDQLNPSKVGFVEGAQPGEFSHSISGETYTSLLVTPIRYAETIVHWESADADGKRPLGTYAKGCPDVPPHDMIDGWKMEAKDGSFLQPALQFVLWVRDAESGIDLGPALFVAKSTGLKYARKWKDRFLLKMARHPKTGAPVKVPFIAQEFAMKSMQESGDRGIWYSPTWDKGTNLTDMTRLGMYAEAREAVPADVFFRTENQEGDDTSAGAPEPSTEETPV